MTYVEDSIAPLAPTGLVTSPVATSSRANDNNPEVTGTAEAGSTVRIYSKFGSFPPCPSDPADGSGSAAQFSAPGLTVPVANNTQTLFFTTATDAAGNTSPCGWGVN